MQLSHCCLPTPFPWGSLGSEVFPMILFVDRVLRIPVPALQVYNSRAYFIPMNYEKLSHHGMGTKQNSSLCPFCLLEMEHVWNEVHAALGKAKQVLCLLARIRGGEALDHSQATQEGGGRGKIPQLVAKQSPCLGDL